MNNLCMIYYGQHSPEIDQRIIDAHPEYLVDNSPAGPWKGNASISKFTSAGIKYFEYIDGGYEGAVAQAIPNDLQSNLNYINAAASAGAYGVFLDEVTAWPFADALNYLEKLSDRADSLGLKVVFNPGVGYWDNDLMDLCDYIVGSENWNNAPLTTSQSEWASRTWLLTQNVTNESVASFQTNVAISKGINAHYACKEYITLPYYLEEYVSLLDEPEPEPVPEPKPEPEPDNIVSRLEKAEADIRSIRDLLYKVGYDLMAK